MEQRLRTFTPVFAALAGAFAVAGAALAAHGLEGRAALWMERASLQAAVHALALLATAALGLARPAVVTAFAGGIVLFSGSLAAMALGAPQALARITPVGGTLFIAGWLLLAWSALRARGQGPGSGG